jgi:hypothetical protein
LATISLLTGSPTAAFIFSIMVIFGGVAKGNWVEAFTFRGFLENQRVVDNFIAKFLLKLLKFLLFITGNLVFPVTHST